MDPDTDRRGRPLRTVARAAFVGALLLAGVTGCSSSDDEAGTTVPSDPSGPDGDVIGSGDRYQATIRRATGEVPHVTGATVVDAAFGQGFASGEDHTCDLADQVVKIRGERARWLGTGDDDAHINSDIAWRAIGIHERAASDWASVPPENQEIFEAFTAGWNTHLSEVGPDGIAGWCSGAEWVQPLEPVDVYAYARAVILLASSAQLTGFIPSASPPEVAAAEGLDAPTEPAGDPSGGADDTDPATGSASASAPATDGARAPSPTDVDLGAFATGVDVAEPEDIGSNGWAIGKDRSENGGGMLVANPHFPWAGELRFWEVHLTVPGEADIYGVQLTGLPGVGIGFTDEFAWTHTVSAGNRFTAYRLSLQDGSPTTYRYGDGWREMTPTDHTIEVLGDDGTVIEETHTTWASHYGPVIDFPGFGWSEEATITIRDANIENDEFVDQYFGMLKAQSFDEFVDIHSSANGVPLFNTVAASADGRAWYADTSATPNLSAEALAAYEDLLETDMITKIAADGGAVLLDGSDPLFEWVEVEGARDPGLVPPKDQPRVERSDYVFNANDSFWVPHASALLSGDYSPLHGRQGTVRSTRTRENAAVLDDTSATGASGEDGLFSLNELADAALANRSYTTRELLDPVVERCRAATGPIDVEEKEGTETAPGLPAASIDVTPACDVLADWDGIYDLDRAGPPLWREFLAGFPSTDLFDRGTGTFWAEPFDPSRPVTTPSGLAPAPAEGPDPVLVGLARAIQTLETAGFAPDSLLGDVQFVNRNGLRVPVHGGNGLDGTTNVVGAGGLPPTVQDPALHDEKLERLVAGSSLYRLDGETGTPIVFGSSFLMALEFTGDGPNARAFLVYGNTEDREHPEYTAATERFSRKEWRDIEFREEAIAAATTATVTVKG